MKKNGLYIVAVLVIVVVGIVIAFSRRGGTGASGSTAASSGTAAAPKAEAPKQIVIKFGHNYALDHPAEITAQRMKTQLAEKSGGRLVLQTYPSAQLGASRELMTGIMNNTVEMCLTSTFGTVEQQILSVELPYMFKNYQHIRAFQASPQSGELLGLLSAQKVKALGWWPVGFRNIGNNKREVRTLADLKGLVIRAFENNMLTDTLTALGAQVTVMPVGEVYVAIQTGAVDGEENPFLNTYTMKFFEVQKYKTETRHLFNWDVIALSKTFWDGLSAEDQKIIAEVAAEGTAMYTDLVEKSEETCKQKLLENKIVITSVDDYAPWYNAVQPVYAKWKDILDMKRVDAIRALVK